MIRFGFEGASTAVQKASKNKVSRRELETALHYLHEAEDDFGVFNGHRDSTWDIGIYLLIGMPRQTVDEVVEAIEYINVIGGKNKTGGVFSGSGNRRVPGCFQAMSTSNR